MSSPPHPGAPRKREVWTSVEEFICETSAPMKEAKLALSTITDQGTVAKPSWTTLPGGDSDRRVVRCNAHEDCCVKVRIRIVCGIVNLSRNDAEHSTVDNHFDRTNAKLTREEKSEMATARGYGGTPAMVVSKMSAAAVKANATASIKKVGNDVAGLVGGSPHPAPPHPPSHPGATTNAIVHL